MSRVSASVPPSSGDLPSTAVPRLRGPIQLGLLTTDLDSESVFAALQLAIARSSAERDVILAAIAEAAQALTDASGAALAIQCDGAIICRARSGDTAPALGARLSVDSGISGECLRTGQVLRCDDTEKDILVDPEVCRLLGLRSIAVVPLRGRRGPTGILEVFSTRACAFADEHVSYLARLAGLAEAAQERGVRAERPVVGTAESKAVAQPIESRPVEGPAKGTRSSYAWPAFAGGKLRYWAGAGILALLLISVLSWRARRTPSSEAAPAVQPAQSAATAAEISAGSGPAAALVWKPSPIRTGTRTSGIEAGGAVQPAAKIEITDLTKDTDNPAVVSPNTSSPPMEKKPGENTSDAVEQAPQIPTPGTDPAAIGSLVVAPATVPHLGAPLSQGVSEAVLQYQVQPVYPQEALLGRLEGRVVLQATITEDGKIENVIVINGNSILARAAADAIQQWQYRPALLNGKPIRTQRQITVSFAAP